MKQKSLRKGATVLLLMFSLGSYLFVNSDYSRPAGAKTEIEVAENNKEEVRELPVPAVNLLTRLAELTHKLMLRRQ
jgi:hypothetical protein